MKKNILIETICFLLVFLFVYTGASKLIDHNIFSLQLYKAPIIGKYKEIVAWVLPLSELGVAALLVYRPARFAALYISLFMLITFTVYLGGMLLFSKDLPCHCGGVISQMSWKQHIVFNLFFIILTMTGIVLMVKYSTKSLRLTST